MLSQSAIDYSCGGNSSFNPNAERIPSLPSVIRDQMPTGIPTRRQTPAAGITAMLPTMQSQYIRSFIMLNPAKIATPAAAAKMTKKGLFAYSCG
jgi:hypothetical protein